MRHIGTARVTRGSIPWALPRLNVKFFPKGEPAAASSQAAAPPGTYAIDRDRIFDYVKTHKLPGERARQVRRDLRNSVDFFSDVRDLQTHAEVDPA